MASGEWLVGSGKILLILIIGGIGVQTSYAKKDKNTAVKDTTAKDTVAVVVAEKETKIAKKDTAAVKTAAEKEETVIKVDGILELGFDNQYRYKEYKNDRVTYKRIGRAEVGASFRPVKKVRAEMGFEWNSKDSVPTIDKLYAQYSPLNFNAIRFGYMKKSFGLEEKAGLDERYFHKRSIINDFLDSSAIGFLGHDLTLQYRHELGKKLELRGGFSWTADSTRYLQNYSVEYDDKKNILLLAAIIKHVIPPDEDMITTYVSSLSYKRTERLFASEAELTYGTNPYIKRFDDRDATILGARLKENFFINTGTSILNQVIPLAEAAIFSRDFKKDSTEFDAQFRAGLTLGFAKKSAFQWRNNYGTVYRIKESKKDLWRRRFDTEIVVVF
ncbi:hypothetical protein R83H12_00740 [Fibrobacteria bacterium R8-3-H12]